MAEAQLRSILRLDPDYTGRVYPCIYCKGWHVGRPRKSAHKNKYAKKNSDSKEKRHA